MEPARLIIVVSEHIILPACRGKYHMRSYQGRYNRYYSRRRPGSQRNQFEDFPFDNPFEEMGDRDERGEPHNRAQNEDREAQDILRGLVAGQE